MEAKDTITFTPESEISEYIKVAKNMQAAISFEAGYEQKCFETYEAGVKDGRLEGRQEVMEWLESHRGIPAAKRHPDSRMYFSCEQKEFQDQLKTWGLEEGDK